MSAPHTYVFLSTTDWDAYQFGSRQQLALRLAQRGNRVLFVEVPRAIHSLISDPAGTVKSVRRLGRVRVLASNLLAYTPLPVFPGYYVRGVAAINQRLLLTYVRRTLARLHWAPDVLWTYWPVTSHLIDRIGARLAVYHCTDDFAAAGYPFASARTIETMEAEQCQRAQLIITRTEGLAAVKRQLNPNTFCIPGGVDTRLFDPGRAIEPPAELRPIPTPRAGFAGTLDDRFDVGLLVQVARRLPHVAFVLAGPVRRHRVRLGELQRLPNVHLLPARAHADVPALISGFHVCLIPYRSSRFTESVSSLKLYEYLAMGKPVVATDLPYHRREAENITIARTEEEFADGIVSALETPASRSASAARREIARTYDWDRHLDQIDELVAAALARA